MKQSKMQQFTETTHNLSGAIMLTGQTLISAFFVIVILVLVLIVEIQRVAHGILLFEQSENLAYLGAFVLVMMLLTLEFVVHYVEAKNDYHEELQTENSFRVWWESVAYFWGWRKDWKPRHKSPAQSIKSYSRLLTSTILALAVAGSMSGAISQVDGNWISGLEQIALQSTLAEIIQWTGGLLFALALVIGTQRLTAYVAQRASETLLEASSNVSIDKYVDTTINMKSSINHQELDDTQPLIVTNVYDDADLLQQEENHAISCPHCEWSNDGYSSERYANQALKMHIKANHQELLEVVS